VDLGFSCGDVELRYNLVRKIRVWNWGNFDEETSGMGNGAVLFASFESIWNKMRDWRINLGINMLLLFSWSADFFTEMFSFKGNDMFEKGANFDEWASNVLEILFTERIIYLSQSSDIC